MDSNCQIDYQIKLKLADWEFLIVTVDDDGFILLKVDP